MNLFTYNHDVGINAILYLCGKAKNDGLVYSFMHIAKLLFFCDKTHLQKYGRPITGDTYIAMKDGPNPSSIYDYLKEVRSRHEDHYIRVAELPNPPYRPIPQLQPKVEADITLFSKSDLEVLDEIYSIFGKKSAMELRALSHEDRAWKDADYENCEIDYQSFLDPEKDKAMVAYVNNIQEEWADLGR